MTQPTAVPVVALPDDIEATLVLCRHGESTWIVEGRFQGAADPPLSPVGQRQAAHLASRLGDRGRIPILPIPSGPPIAIWHSPLARTSATATPVGAALGVPLTAQPDLREIGQGAWEGRLVADILASDGDLLRAWRQAPVGHEAPGGETLVQAAVRGARALEHIVDRLAEASRARGGGDPDRAPVIGYGSAASSQPWGLVVGHDGLLRVIVLTLLGLPLERFWTFPFVPAGISVLEFHRGHAIVRAHNLDEHLAPLQRPDPTAGREGAL
jgi:probable phosphoglycerate mutase